MNNFIIEIVNDLPLLTVFVDDLTTVEIHWNNVKDAFKILRTENIVIYKYKNRILKFEIYTTAYKQTSKEVIDLNSLLLDNNKMEI